MAGDEYRRAPAPGYIYEQFSPYYYMPEDEGLPPASLPPEMFADVKSSDRWFKPWTWGSNNNWYKPWDWETFTNRPQPLADDEYETYMEGIRQQLEYEEGMSDQSRSIQAEASFSPWEAYIRGMGAAGMADSAAYSAMGGAVAGDGQVSQRAEDFMDVGQRELELTGRSVSDRAAVAGRLRTTAEMAGPVLIGASFGFPVGAGFRMLPAAFQGSRVGSMFAPMTGRVGKPLQWMFSRGAPAGLAATAITNELPGQTVPHLAPETAALGAAVGTMSLGNVIKNALGGKIGRFGRAAAEVGSLAAGMGAGFGAAWQVGDRVDEKRVQEYRNWAFQDQERLDWAYDEHPEWFPEWPR